MREDMALTANTVVDNKFWIVEQDGKKVATIQTTNFGVVFVVGEKREPHASIKTLCKKYDISIKKSPKKSQSSTQSVDGYPCDVVPFNALYDVSKKLPVYTKDPDSKSFFCAGHYLVKNNSTWIPTYCPKLIMLNRSEFRGPYRTKDELNTALKAIRANR